MIRAALAALAVIGALAIGCGQRAAPSGPRSDDAVVVLKSNVRDAQVYIDGRFVAPLNALRGGVALAAGAHRLELRHEDYFSSYLELQLARAERRTVALDLAAILP